MRNCSFSTMIILIIFFQLNSCSSQESVAKLKKANTSKAVRTEISIEVTKISGKIGSLRAIDENYIYGLFDKRESVVIFSLAGEPLYEHQLTGEGPGKIGVIHNIYPYTNDRFIVHDIRGAYVYNFDGRPGYKCPELMHFANVGSIPGGFSTKEHHLIFPALNPEIPVRTDGYYSLPEVFFVAELNLKNCSVLPGGSVPFNSNYRKKLLPVRQRGYIERVGEDKFLLYFQFDKTVQILDLNTFEVLEVIELQPNHFGEVSGATEYALQEMTRLSQINPAYKRMAVTDDGQYLITQYTSSSDEYVDAEAYLGGTKTDVRKQYVEVYNLKTKEKMFEEITDIPKHSLLLKAKSLSEIYFFTDEHEEVEGTFLVKVAFN